MKKNIRKILSAVCAVLLVVLLSGALFACNKNKDKDKKAEQERRERTESVATIRHEILHAMDGNWAGDMSDDQVATLENAGDYVVASGWADMACDVFFNSALQTGKLTALKNYVKSDDGQKLLKDFSGNAEYLIPLLRSADFTSTDISNLTYDLLCSLVANSAQIFDGISARLVRLRGMSGISYATASNLDSNIVNLAVIKRDFVPSDAEKQSMLTAFERAKTPLAEIVEFAYNMSIGSVTDSIFDALFSQDGALTDITNGEISTVINTLLSNANSLKVALNDDALANINSAINLIISKFDRASGASTLYGEVVRYAKYVNMVVDVIPALCSFSSSAGKVFDDALINSLRNVVGKDLDDKVDSVNEAIILAKIVLQVGKDMTKSQLLGIVDKIGASVGEDHQKALPVIILDVALNLSSWFDNLEEANFDGKHPDIIAEADVKALVGAILMALNLDKAKKSFYDYQNEELSFSVLDNAMSACGFENFGIENTINRWQNPKGWAEYYLTEGVSIANRKTVEVCQKAVRDIKKFVEDFYAQNSQSKAGIEAIANMQLVDSNLSSDEYGAYESAIMRSDLFGILVLISLIPAQ